MLSHQVPELRLLVWRHRVERDFRKLHPPPPARPRPLFENLYRNPARKFTQQSLRLEIRQSQSEQQSALRWESMKRMPAASRSRVSSRPSTSMTS